MGITSRQGINETINEKEETLGKNGSYLKAEKKHLSSFPLYSMKSGKFIVPEFLRRCKLISSNVNSFPYAL